jgi:hypothetical protein
MKLKNKKEIKIMPDKTIYLALFRGIYLRNKNKIARLNMDTIKAI